MSAHEFDPHISVEPEPIASVRNPDYCIRSIEIENLNRTVNTPLKVVSGDGITENEFNHYSNEIPNPIFESARTVQSPDSWGGLEKYLTVYSANERNRSLREFFKIKNKKFWEKSDTTLSLSFPRNPFEQQKFKSMNFEGLDEDSYMFLLNFIYSNSSTFVLVPDIKIDSNDFVTEYLRIIDYGVKIFQDLNNKPIFVPLPIAASQAVSIKILKHYKEKGYSNIWINFNNKSCDSDFSTNLRSNKQLIDKYMAGLDVVLYCSHIKKEILPHLQDTRVASSDILTQFFGIDFIGVKRFGGGRPISDTPEDLANEALKNNFPSVEEYKVACENNATRLFSPTTYYCHNLNEYPDSVEFDASLLTNPVHNKIANSLQLHKEVESVKSFVEEHSDLSITNRPLRHYLQQKRMILENASIRDAIIPKIITTTLSDHVSKDISKDLSELI